MKPKEEPTKNPNCPKCKRELKVSPYIPADGSRYYVCFCSPNFLYKVEKNDKING